tara:strand:+ start:331 stop:486 length:156 start_codon:yes stop_codon:yes gene_type:complete
MKKYGETSIKILWDFIIKYPTKKDNRYAPASPNINKLLKFKMIRNNKNKKK